MMIPQADTSAALFEQIPERAARGLVLDPPGMTDFAAEVMTLRFAVGHGERDGEVRVSRPWPVPRAANAAGACAARWR